jgi:hypothetical protein
MYFGGVQRSPKENYGLLRDAAVLLLRLALQTVVDVLGLRLGRTSYVRGGHSKLPQSDQKGLPLPHKTIDSCAQPWL